MTIKKSGEFLIKETKIDEVFIPEEFSEEQLMIAQTCTDFLETEVYPHLDRIDDKEEGFMVSLLKKAGELGLLGIVIPEEYNGFGQSFLTLMRANEAIGPSYSFSVAFMAHTGIGSLPLLLYGNAEQKQRYLTRMATGELIAAYCLTEPNAGSDANAGKSKAVLSEDGKHYILNGQKTFITNGGIADIQTVFAKIDNDKILSAFMVETNWEGITLNAEEKKMGIKGSSTVQIFYNDVKVPVENLLGKRGEGFRIALNTLHIGRIKLGVIVVGQAKHAITQSVNYANERKQFGSLISSFGAIKFKLAEQVIRTFASESAVYRASKDINDKIAFYVEQGMTKEEAKVKGISDFAAECALLKVFCSESYDYVVDETVQIFGGMGYSAEMPADRAYRDSRINRIFEGTNEINRLVMIEAVLKNGMKGDINLFAHAEAIANELNNISEDVTACSDYYKEKKTNISNFKKIILMVIDAASKKLTKQLFMEQEILMNFSDAITQLYVAESTLLRVEKLQPIKGEEGISIYKDILDVFVYDAADIIRKCCSDAMYSFAEGDEIKTLSKALHIFTKVAGVNIKQARRKIADKLIEDNRYTF